MRKHLQLKHGKEFQKAERNVKNPLSESEPSDIEEDFQDGCKKNDEGSADENTQIGTKLLKCFDQQFKVTHCDS